MSTPHRIDDPKHKVAEEVMMRKFRAKCRFRAIVRMVMANCYWLSEDVDVYEGDNVKKRVEQAMRSKAKQTKQLLNLSDKALLCKPAEERTEHEKKYIYRIIGGLKCFKRYPNIVKKKLAAVTYFKYYGPGRVIVRQHHEAHALYFIMSGEVVVSVLIFDELTKKTNSVDVGTMTVGNMFGEVSLLHNIPRTATCTTSGHCEFLQLMKDDFKTVLQDSVQKEWNEIKLAMSAFTYFDSLDPVSRRECCIVSKLKTYAPNETILGDGVGASNFIYFILSGHCQMIETLQVLVTKTHGRKSYKLYDPYVPEEESEQDFDKKYFQAYKDKHAPDKNKSNASEHTASNTVGKKSIASEHITSSTIGKKSIGSEHITSSTIGKKWIGSERLTSNTSSTVKSLKRESLVSQKKSELKRQGTSSPRKMSNASVKPCKSSSTITQRTTPSKILLAPDDQEQDRRISIRYSTDLPSPNPLNLQTFFMQVCQFLPGSTFGFGENMRDRRIVALTRVDCMLMPTVWLLQRNTNNIWTRIQHYLEKKIPTKREIFKEFVLQRRWNEYREKVVADVVSRSRTVNYTTVSDVPYSIRMEEELDI